MEHYAIVVDLVTVCGQSFPLDLGLRQRDGIMSRIALGEFFQVALCEGIDLLDMLHRFVKASFISTMP